MVKVKLRFENYWARDQFINCFQKEIYLIKKSKCKISYDIECRYQIILWIDLPYKEGTELIYNYLQRTIKLKPSAFDLCYIKEGTKNNERT